MPDIQCAVIRNLELLIQIAEKTVLKMRDCIKKGSAFMCDIIRNNLTGDLNEIKQSLNDMYVLNGRING